MKNSSTRLFVTLQGILIGFSEIIHGAFEIKRGNIPTEGFLLKSVGACTIIPNYLITGIVSVIIGIAIILWTSYSIHKKNGPSIYLLLSVISFFVGGGVAQTIFFCMTWGVSTRITKPLTWWGKILSVNVRETLSKFWLLTMILAYSFISFGVAIWLILLPPTESIKNLVVQYICWSLLIIGIIFQIIAIISGFARDIEKRQTI
jgi:hypothetical protein